ncbi:glycosyltransferase [Klebsiella pneumoniae subsp. pneumoniae]|nr:glycosyltransferase [Klebsiella pneumoniae subsp. pneumoniae]
MINQTYKNIEIIICNDGSGDNTDDVVNKLQKNINKDIPFVYLKNESDSHEGHVSARNRCIAAASGYYLTGLDDDDYFYQIEIESLIKVCNER